MSTEVYRIIARTLAPFSYTGGYASVLGIAGLADTVYSVTATSLYEHTGDDDDGEPIVPTLTTGALTLAPNMEYNVPKASFAAIGPGTVSVARETKERGLAFNPDTYTMALTSEIDQYELPLETRQLARSWKFTIQLLAPTVGTNVGSDIETFSVYVNPSRHRK